MKIMELNTKEYEELVKKRLVEEEKKIPEKITPESMIKSNQSINDDIIDKINEIITYLESKGE